MSDDGDAPPELEAAVAEFQAAVIDADVRVVGKDEEYVPDSPRLQKQMGKYEDE
jgi:hypothetical protein